MEIETRLYIKTVETLVRLRVRAPLDSGARRPLDSGALTLKSVCGRGGAPRAPCGAVLAAGGALRGRPVCCPRPLPARPLRVLPLGCQDMPGSGCCKLMPQGNM
jgi:hypothetical protein